MRNQQPPDDRMTDQMRRHAGPTAAALPNRAREPSPWLLAMDRARAHEARGEWAHAEEALVEARDHALAAGKPVLLWYAHDGLASIRRMVGDPDAELARLREALAAARRATDPTFVCLALERLAGALLGRGAADDAMHLTVEAHLLLDAHPGHHAFRPGALILRARCHLALQDVDAAEADLAAAERFLEPIKDTAIAARVQGDAATWWDTTYEVRARRGDKQGAVEALGHAVTYRRRVATATLVSGPHSYADLADALEHYASALQAIGEEEPADAARQEAAAIRDPIASGSLATRMQSSTAQVGSRRPRHARRHRRR